jgi:hypothetical protein
MAKKIVLGMKNDNLPVGKMITVGVFSQKKKMWEVLEELDPDIEKKYIYDDVSGRSAEANYSRTCNLMTKAGRVHILDTDKKTPLFFMVECEENTVRDSDFDDDNEPIYNPAVKKDEG